MRALGLNKAFELFSSFNRPLIIKMLQIPVRDGLIVWNCWRPNWTYLMVGDKKEDKRIHHSRFSYLAPLPFVFTLCKETMQEARRNLDWGWCCSFTSVWRDTLKPSGWCGAPRCPDAAQAECASCLPNWWSRISRIKAIGCKSAVKMKSWPCAAAFLQLLSQLMGGWGFQQGSGKMHRGSPVANPKPSQEEFSSPF